MSIGPFQHLQSSHEVGSGSGLACEPWLLPITDRVASAVAPTADDLKLAVSKAARPFWLAANGLCIALGLFVTLQVASGWNASGDLGPVAASSPPTIPAQTAAYANASH